MDQLFKEFMHSNQINPISLAPVLLVVVGVLLVFTFGFKKPVQPPFKKLLTSSTSKKVKRKEKSKPAQNGNVGSGSKSDSIPISNSAVSSNELTKKSIGQLSKSIDQSIKSDDNKSNRQKSFGGSGTPSKKSQGYLNELKKNTVKIRKTNNPIVAKSNDNEFNNYDEGEWKTVMSKTDKKKKIEEIANIMQNENKVKRNYNAPVGINEKKDNSQKSSKNRKEHKNQENKENKVKDEVIPDKVIQKETEELIEQGEQRIPEKLLNNDEQKQIQEEQDPQVNGRKLLREINEEIELFNEKIKSIGDKDPHLQNPTLLKVEVIKDENIGNVVFDELKDAWSEPKTSRKQKKKIRRE